MQPDARFPPLDVCPNRPQQVDVQRIDQGAVQGGQLEEIERAGQAGTVFPAGNATGIRKTQNLGRLPLAEAASPAITTEVVNK